MSFLIKNFLLIFNNLMKKNFLILCLLLTSAAYSQNNLQFSKVITESFSIASGEYGAGIQFSTLKTVPTGKVWKIESIFPNYINIFRVGDFET